MNRMNGIGEDQISLSRTVAVDLGSAVVSTAVFGVSPKTLRSTTFHLSVGCMFVRLAGETPARATETVALPNPTVWLAKEE
jgi:hypothetical protein